MEQNICNTCVHYQQHYALDQHGIFRVYCGHCTYLKVRARKPDSKICESYIKTEHYEQMFVRKEYLSKVLLERVLNMELLPEIGDMRDKDE